jgi:glycosyltransferase involved in cell wall biosynthesis
MRVLVDYRPALRERTGVGEYVHNLVRALAERPEAEDDQIWVITSSWKDRPPEHLSRELGTGVVDRRVPVRVLNYLWHRIEWPPVEWLGPDVDVVHAAHPLLIPTTNAAQVVTVHDLFFLTNRDATHAEIRRDYATLAPTHAQRADAVIVNSKYTASLVQETFGVAKQSIHVCTPGAPTWSSLGRTPNVPPNGYILFIGTLEKRKNIGTLLDAYCRLLERCRQVPPLVLAGRASCDAKPWLERLRLPPLAGHVHHAGYVTDKEDLFRGARLLVIPSLDEGFGLPALEAMAAGVPVVAADRGALPEVLGDAGVLVDPTDAELLAAAIQRMISDECLAARFAERGLARARRFSWQCSAGAMRQAYECAVEVRQRRRRIER